MVYLIGRDFYSAYALLLNSYVQKTGLVKGYELYCAKSGTVKFRVKQF